jgi:hypothetical protein
MEERFWERDWRVGRNQKNSSLPTTPTSKTNLPLPASTQEIHYDYFISPYGTQLSNPTNSNSSRDMKITNNRFHPLRSPHTSFIPSNSKTQISSQQLSLSFPRPPVTHVKSKQTGRGGRTPFSPSVTITPIIISITPTPLDQSRSLDLDFTGLKANDVILLFHFWQFLSSNI